MLKSTPDITTTILKTADYQDKELRLEWSPVPYSLYYEIYRATNQAGPYTKLGTTWSGSTIGENGSLDTFFYDDLDGGIPEPPTVISTDRAGLPGTIRVYWSAPADPASSNAYYYRIKAFGVEGLDSLLTSSPTVLGQLTPTIMKYQIFNSTSSSGPWTNILGEAETTYYIHSGLGQGTIMYYKLKAISSEDYQSTLSQYVWGMSNRQPSITNIRIEPINAYTTDIFDAKYTFSDPDGDTEYGSQIRWYRDGNLFPWYKSRIYSSWTTKGQVWYFTITPKDGIEYGTGGTSGSITILNSPPKLSNVKIMPIDPTTLDSLSLSYTYSDADTDSKTNVEIHWYKNGNHQSAYDGYSSVPSSATLKADIWNASVRVSDGTDPSIWYQPVARTVINTKPVTSSLKLSPADPKTTDPLAASYTYFDTDSDNEGNSKIEWYKDDQLQTSFTNVLIIPASATSKAEVWYFTVTPNDGEDDGESVTSQSVKIENTAPEILSMTISPEDPKTTDHLSITYDYFDKDGDPAIGSRIKWYCNDKHMITMDDTYLVLPEATTRGERWQYSITPKDGYIFGETCYSESVVIQNSAPELLSATIEPTRPAVADDLEAKFEFNDPDGDMISQFKINWFKDSNEQETLANLSQVSSEFTGPGEVWHFEIQISDDTEYSPIYNSTVVKINNPPVAEKLIITPEHPITTDSLTVSYQWSDLDENNQESGTIINWYCNDKLIEDLQNSLEVSSDLTKKRETWHFTVLPSDGLDSGELYKSDSKIIGNSLPVVSELKIKPNNPQSYDELTANYHYYDIDSDHETGSSIRWYKNGKLLVELNDESTVNSNMVFKDDVWYYTVKPTDGDDFGAVEKSQEVKISNSAPIIESAKILPESPTTIDSLSVDFQFYDDDPIEKLRFEYQWYKNNVLQPTLADQREIPSSLTRKGEVWSYALTIYDTTDRSKITRSDPIVIQNSAPTVEEVSIIPEAPPSKVVLTLSYTYYDVDDDSEQGTEIRWYKNNELVEYLNDESEIPAVIHEPGEEWYCTIRLSDGDTFSEMITSAIVRINIPPEVKEIELSPSKPTTEDTLELSYTYYDSDLDSEADTEIQWYRNDEPVKELTGFLSITPDYLKSGDRWYVEVQPNDGNEFGLQIQSNEVQISDTETTDQEADSTDKTTEAVGNSLLLWIVIISIVILAVILLLIIHRKRKHTPTANRTFDITLPESLDKNQSTTEPEIDPEPEEIKPSKPITKGKLVKQQKLKKFKLKDVQLSYDNLDIEFKCDKCDAEIEFGIDRCPKCGEEFGEL